MKRIAICKSMKHENALSMDDNHGLYNHVFFCPLWHEARKAHKANKVALQERVREKVFLKSFKENDLASSLIVFF